MDGSASKQLEALSAIYNEAVYGKTAGQELAKREKDDDAAGAPRDKRHVVTNADKKANTPAYQKYKSGDKNYKAADHMKEEELHEKEVKVKDTRRTVDAIRAYDKSKDASRDADWDTEHGEKEKGDIEKKYAKKERGEIDKDDPNWKKRKYHTGIHGEAFDFEPSEIVSKLIESGKFSIDEVWKIVEVEEGYQRNPEKGEAEERKAEKRRKESGRMPPRGDKRREDFEKWYAANVR